MKLGTGKDKTERQNTFNFIANFQNGSYFFWTVSMSDTHTQSSTGKLRLTCSKPLKDPNAESKGHLPYCSHIASTQASNLMLQHNHRSFYAISIHSILLYMVLLIYHMSDSYMIFFHSNEENNYRKRNLLERIFFNINGNKMLIFFSKDDNLHNFCQRILKKGYLFISFTWVSEP